MPSENDTTFKDAMSKGHSAAWEADWKEALKHYSRALKEFPQSAQALNSLALAQFELGELPKALETYKQAAQRSPDDPLPVEKAAQIYALNGQVEQAIEYSRRSADLYLNIRDTDKAITSWARIISLEPENLEAHALLAKNYEDLGRTEQAITEFIAVASLLQNAGKLEEAQQAGKYALELDPKNKEAQNANEQLGAFESLPLPIRKGAAPGLFPLPKERVSAVAKAPPQTVDEGLDPLEEANQLALEALAGMLFDLAPAEAKKSSGIRAIARVVADGLMSRGFDEKKIVQHLSRAIELLGQNEAVHAADTLKAAIEAGLDHPAAHFKLGALRADMDRRESAQRSFQRALKHTDYAMAARLLMAKYLKDQGRIQEASTEYLQALKLADSSIVAEDQAEALGKHYDPLIEALSNNKNEKKLEQLCENIYLLLMRPNWRKGMEDARGQLPSSKNDSQQPLADILMQANSGFLVDALANVNQLAREGKFRSAVEETFTAMEFAPSYLPLHIRLAELMLTRKQTQPAIAKFATIARVYSARGESQRATQMYERIVDASPLDTEAREHLIDQITAQGDFNEAIAQYLKLADVYYRLAQLEAAKESYEKALNLAKDSDVDSEWTAQILHQMADIDLQRLDWRKALALYEQLRELAPSDESARLNLIQLNLRMGKEAKADAELDKYLAYLKEHSEGEGVENFLQGLIQETPEFVSGLRRLAEHYQKIGENKKAIDKWNKLGEVLIEQGDREGAKTALRTILSLDPPDAERYQQFLQRLSN